MIPSHEIIRKQIKAAGYSTSLVVEELLIGLKPHPHLYLGSLSFEENGYLEINTQDGNRQQAHISDPDCLQIILKQLHASASTLK